MYCAPSTGPDDYLDDSYAEKSQFPRRCKRILFVGAEGTPDVSGTLMYGNKEVAKVYNTHTTAGAWDANDVQSVSSKMVCLPTEEMSFIMSGTATNACYLMLDIEEFMPRGRGRGRGRWRGRRRYRRRWR